MSDTEDARSGRRRLRDQRGTAVVELSIAVVLLLTLLFGIITFGYILSFKQGMTQAAAEGTRAGAVVTESLSAAAAKDAAEKSTDTFDKTCDTADDADGDGLACSFTIVPCVPGPPSAKCIEVIVEYDYANHPLLPRIPLIEEFMPDTLRSRSVAEVDS